MYVYINDYASVAARTELIQRRAAVTIPRGCRSLTINYISRPAGFGIQTERPLVNVIWIF